MLGTFLTTRTVDKIAPLRIALSVLGQIRRSIGNLPAEHGGVLGGQPESGIVTHFHFDSRAARTGSTYSPDIESLNRLFLDDWNPKGIRMMGFVHSHPGLRHLSGGDIAYARRILEAIPDLRRLLTPIVISAADASRFEFLPFAVVTGDDGITSTGLALAVLDEAGLELLDWESALESHLAAYLPRTSGLFVRESALAYEIDSPGVLPDSGNDAPTTIAAVIKTGVVSNIDIDVAAKLDPVPETFRRVVHAYDLELLRNSRIIYVGAGGAAGFIEDLARAGVGQHVLIDADTVSETNLATQQAYRRDLGRLKVDAIAERILDINPRAIVLPLNRSLDDIDDASFEFYATAASDRTNAERIIICGLTDNFYAQSRVNRLALQFGLPSLCAQVYREGRGAEITFTHPDVTPACHRCVLSARYRAYLEKSFVNDVTSDGTPIFATGRLNALKGYIALALLHHGTRHPRWGGLLKRIGKRNLVQLRLDPDFAENVGIRVFDRVFEKADRDRLLFDEAVWLPQEPDVSHCCPDCGSTGNLRDCLGTNSDTRPMRN